MVPPGLILKRIPVAGPVGYASYMTHFVPCLSFHQAMLMQREGLAQSRSFDACGAVRQYTSVIA